MLVRGSSTSSLVTNSICATPSETVKTLTHIIHMDHSPSPPPKVQVTSSTINESETQNDLEEDDLAKPEGMTKSVVGLVTTASVYAELGRFPQDEDVNNKKETKKHDQVIQLPTNSVFFDETITLRSTCGYTNEPQMETDFFGSKSELLSKFNVNSNESVVEDYSCWLLNDALIHGHIYLTFNHLLFYAEFPKSNDLSKMAGTLTTGSMGSISGRMTQYWAVLKNHTLSLYHSSADLYFPTLTIDLRNVFKVIIYKQNEDLEGSFKILMRDKTYDFDAGSFQSAKIWYSKLKRQVFISQNAEKDSMQINIDLKNILDVDQQSILNQSKTLKIRALESCDTFAIDEYFLIFFNQPGLKLKENIDRQTKILQTFNYPFKASLKERISLQSESSTSLLSGNNFISRGKNDESTFHLGSSVLKQHVLAIENDIPLKYLLPISYSNAREKIKSMTGSFNKIFINTDIAKKKELEQDLRLQNFRYIRPNASNSTLNPNNKIFDENQTINCESINNSMLEENRQFQGNKILKWAPASLKNMGCMWHAQPAHYRLNSTLFSEDDKYLVKHENEEASNKRFKGHFSLSDDDYLIGAYYGYLNKNIPIYGKFYVGNKCLCFRSLLPGIKTKMILPFDDIETCYRERGFRFGFFGSVLVIHGHEELFIEFTTKVASDDFEVILLKLLDDVKLRRSDFITDNFASIPHDNFFLTNNKLKIFEDDVSSTGFDISMGIQAQNDKSKLKLNVSYRFGLLTIGSRGDVQPYIALGNGLIAEGHQVTIITHKEFGPWVKSHNLNFKAIAGDPAKLMKLMVEHGSMNVGLFRDASSSFRSWITELLNTSWKACQDIDILIESPSAMAGIHIAEALNIPYFRAFTMPWTKTRAYPHALIVPDHKHGGNYNYLTHVLFENIFWKGISSQVNKWRIESLHLKKTNLELLQQGKVPFLYNISPSIFPPSVDFSEWIKVTGYWFLDECLDYQPHSELVEFINRAKKLNKKIVYIGFGSIVVKDPVRMTSAIIDGVIDADVYCILNKGWSERLGDPSSKTLEVDLPECIFNSGDVPHDWLFPQIDAAVHHGGSGTTGATLKAGLPTVIKPFFGDQFFYASRIEDLGAGIALKKLNASSLSRALKEVVSNTRIIKKVQKIKDNIKKENGVATAIRCIYAELEYAKNLMQMKSDKINKNVEISMEQYVSSNTVDSNVNDPDSWLLI